MKARSRTKSRTTTGKRGTRTVSKTRTKARGKSRAGVRARTRSRVRRRGLIAGAKIGARRAASGGGVGDENVSQIGSLQRTTLRQTLEPSGDMQESHGEFDEDEGVEGSPEREAS